MISSGRERTKAALHYAAIVSVREQKIVKSKLLDFTHFSTKYYFLVCTGVKMHIFYQKNNISCPKYRIFMQKNMSSLNEKDEIFLTW